MSATLVETTRHHAALDAATLDRLQQSLLAQRSAQVDVVFESQASATELAEHRGSENIVSRELATASAARAREVIRELDAALERMEQGTYGLCGRCRSAIPVARLEALPHARFCVRCAESTSGFLG